MTFLIIAIIVVRSWKAFADLPPMAIDLDKYMESYTIINGTGSDTMQYKDAYSDIIKHSHSRSQLNDLESGDLQDYVLQKVNFISLTIFNITEIKQEYFVLIIFSIVAGDGSTMF